MAAHLTALAAHLRPRLRWLWLLMPAALALDSIRSYLALQILCALLLFATFFLAFAAAMAAFLSVVLIVHSFLAWLISLLSSFPRVDSLTRSGTRTGSVH